MKVGRFVFPVVVCLSWIVVLPSWAEVSAGKPARVNRQADPGVPSDQGRGQAEKSRGSLDEQTEQMNRSFVGMEERVQSLRMQMAKARQTDSLEEWRLLLREHSETLRELLRQMQELTQGVLEASIGNHETGNPRGSSKAVDGMTMYHAIMEKRMILLMNLMEQVMVHVDAVTTGFGGQR
ncbi:MAG: hypothetical protein HQL64_03820 [Magnetococcales bacterium]|nr:hypothetical protein [Magnetococcales bacterium]